MIVEAAEGQDVVVWEGPFFVSRIEGEGRCESKRQAAQGTTDRWGTRKEGGMCGR
jgi:hypothetical protein